MAKEYFGLIIGAILVNNFVLSRFLGICPFLGVSKRIDTAMGMSGAVLFVMTLASLVTAAINKFVLLRFDLAYLQTIVFILVIASLVQLVEIILQRFLPVLYKALGIYLPLITTNCAVLGVAVLASKNSYGVFKTTVFGAASAVGFGLALVLFASLREKLELARVPECMKGTAIALITAGVLAMAFMGFAGLGG
ncbi:MAG: electron transport complex subunit RsxA [Lentisphaerae bacterium]|jgi:Na+-translocating ferredoxin:NAD+ oxidoreductase subunit A|nr:electron transport complex subunit RsxA [Lentisphaerota bacterium]MBT4819760.1 electron transport complex subunit RsxA [Lentisphaerota bacterium]MBT5607559.1 electron transport complex subunit RsxA [Lentisphaerota bacterium]MBT7054580.1 electron transport complex subunit RsxA [Lentisphaerota bacterium]MBT7845180.1 electron transport complex subunit RsxA [Lentisphaerota bacterium]